MNEEKEESPAQDPTWNHNWLKWVEIEGFKSIKKTRFEPKRINVLIGEPNTGKSNILEALGMFRPWGNEKRGVTYPAFLRIDNYDQLFYDFRENEGFTIKSNKVSVMAYQSLNSIFFEYSTAYPKVAFTQEDKRFIINIIEDGKALYSGLASRANCDVKLNYYLFLQNFVDIDYSVEYLSCPSGSSLGDLIIHSGDLKKVLGDFHLTIEALGFGLQLFQNSNKPSELRLISRHTSGLLIKNQPITILADTMRRMMFYHAAIATNKDSVLLFEEPEAHSYPPYVTQFAQWMLESPTNQFFVATHSPYLLETLFNEGGDDVAIFATYLKDGSTQVKELTGEALQFIIDNTAAYPFNLGRILEAEE
jgi:hypothetical protein